MEYTNFMFDVDGTLTATLSGKVCPNTPDDLFVLPGVAAKLKKLKGRGKRISFITNQGGVSHGFMTEHQAWDILLTTNALLGGMANNIKMCCYYPDALFSKRHVDRRKPSPTMLMEDIEDWFNAIKNQNDEDIIPHLYTQSLYVGDAFSDQAAAQAAGIDFKWAHEFFGWPFEAMTETKFGYSFDSMYLEALRNSELSKRK